MVYLTTDYFHKNSILQKYKKLDLHVNENFTAVFICKEMNWVNSSTNVYLYTGFTYSCMFITAYEAWKKKYCNKNVGIIQNNCSECHTNSYVPIQKAIVKRTSSSNNLHATSPAQRDMFGKKLSCSEGLYKKGMTNNQNVTAQHLEHRILYI